MRVSPSTVLHTMFGALGIGLLGFLLYRLDFHAVAARLSAVGWWFLVVLAMHTIALVAATLAWQAVIDKRRSTATFFDLFAVFWAGHAVNYLTPTGTLGEVMRATLLKNKIEPDELVASVISFGFYNLVCAQVLTFVGPILALLFLDLPRAIVLWLFFIALACFVPMALIYVFLRMGAVNRLVRLALKLPFLRAVKKEALIAKATMIDRCIQELTQRRPRDLRRAIAWMAVSRIMVPLSTWLMLSIFLPGKGTGFLLLVSFFTLTASQLISWMISFVPAQIGFSEGGMTLLFKLMGLDPLVGFSLEILRRFQMIVAVTAGLILGAWAIRTHRGQAEAIKPPLAPPP